MFEHPDRVLQTLLRCLDAHTYFSARQVCKAWRSCANGSETLLYHISHALLDSSFEDELQAKIKDIKNTTTIDDQSSVLLDSYLDLVRFKMLRLEAQSVNSVDLDASAGVKCLSHDGTKLLLAQNLAGGFINLTLVDTLTGSQQVYSHTNRRSTELVALSPDNLYVALTTSYGYLEVLKLDPTSMTCKVLYERQYPSLFESVQLSKGAEVFMGKSIRLGGYSLVNLTTKEEIDIGHYRLDLSLVSLYDDLVLSLPGRDDTFIYGWPYVDNNGKVRSVDREPGQLWNYYKYLVKNDIFCYISLKNAVPLPLHKNLLLALDVEEDEEDDEDNSGTKGPPRDIYRLDIIRQSIVQPLGFKTFDEFRSRKRKRENEEEEGEEGEEGEEISTNDDNTNDNNVKNSDESNQDPNDLSASVSEGSVDSTDSDLNEMLNLAEVASPDSYILSLDSTRLALRSDKSTLIIYSLGEDLLNHFDWGTLPGKVIALPDILDKFPISETQMKFIGNDKLVLASRKAIHVIELAKAK